MKSMLPLKINKIQPDCKLRQHLPVSKYQHWFETIMLDDVDKFQLHLNKASPTEQHALLNYPFDFQEFDDLTNLHELATTPIRLPFHIAVAFRSKKIAKLMISVHNVDIKQTDEMYGNVLHSCVLAAHIFPETEDKLCKKIHWLFQEHEEKNDRVCESLLFGENEHGFRPVEYAAQQGCLSLMKTMLEMRGHITAEQERGLGIYRLHDVTEYELGARHSKSPLAMMVCLDWRRLDDLSTAEVLQSPLVEGWISAKIKSNAPLIVVWGFLRLFLFGCFIAIDSNVDTLYTALGNKSDLPNAICKDLSHVLLSATAKQVITSLALLYVSISTVLAVISIIYFKKNKGYLRYLDFSGKKSIVANSIFFTVCNVLLNVVVTFVIAEDVITSMGKELSPAVDLAVETSRGLIPLLAIWNVGYFLQLLPILGSGIINIQGMLVAMAKFMMLFTLILLPFVQVFEMFVQENSTSGCIQEFSSPYMTMYTLFSMMFGLYDVTSLTIKNIGIVYFFHVLFIFTVAVLLLNFLVAIMATSASSIDQNKKSIVRINQLAISIVLEERIFWFTKWLYRKLFRRLGFYCVDGKVCIRSSSSKFKQMLINRC